MITRCRTPGSEASSDNCRSISARLCELYPM